MSVPLRPVAGAGAGVVSTWPVRERNIASMCSSTPPLRHQHEQRLAVLAAEHTRRQNRSMLDPLQYSAALADMRAAWPAILAAVQMAPSASMPCCPHPPSSAQTRRFDSAPSAAMSRAVSLALNDSVTMRSRCPASRPCRSGSDVVGDRRTEPSGVTRALRFNERSAGFELEVAAADIRVAAAVHDDLVPPFARPLRSALPSARTVALPAE